jgi:hypothetical protein
MDPEQLKDLMGVLEALRGDVTAQISKVSERCDALDAAIKKAGAAKSDTSEDADQKEEAVRVAADSVRRSEFYALASSVADLKKKHARPMADLNAFADAQAKADAALRTHNERAEPPMAGEELVNYGIRMQRKMQRHSPKWKGVDLGLISADRLALENIFSEIRADTVTASKSTVGMQPFQYREIVQESPGGHKIRSFHGNGTIFKQMSSPFRCVQSIGPRWADGRAQPCGGD